MESFTLKGEMISLNIFCFKNMSLYYFGAIFSEKYQGSFDPRQGASGHGAELISVTVSTGNERQAMGNTVRGIFRMVRDKQQLCGPFANQHVDKAAH